MKRDFSTWQEYLADESDYSLKYSSLLRANLRFADPKTLRPQYSSHRVWINLIDPEYWSEVQAAYNAMQENPPSALPTELEATVIEDCGRTFIGPLAVLQTQERTQQMHKLLMYFVHRRPDIGYVPGMSNMLAFALSIYAVESSAFGVFVYLIERVFPLDYFAKSCRGLKKHAELRTFSLLSERLRPRIVQTLRAVFRTKSESGNHTRENDYSAFVTFSKRLAEAWFSTLFSTNLFPADLARVWDCLFIFGFDFAHKFALALLSKYERFVRNTIKQEVAILGMGSSVDALIVAGNAARLKLLKKAERQQIERLIRKAIAKPTYSSLTRDQFFSLAEGAEDSQSERTARLRISMSLFQERETQVEDVQRLYEELDRLKTNDHISRRLFQTTLSRGYGWQEKTALNVFTTFDQRGNDTVHVRELQIGIAILTSASLEEKLMLAFTAFDEGKSGVLDPGVVLQLVAMMESVLDCRANSFPAVSSGLFVGMARTATGGVALDDFINSFKESQATQSILDQLRLLESGENFNPREMRVVDFARTGEFSDIMSPITSSNVATPVSETEEEVPDPVDLGARLESLLENDVRESEQIPDDGIFRENETYKHRAKQESSDSRYTTDVPEIRIMSEPFTSEKSLRQPALDPIEEMKEDSEGTRSERRGEAFVVMVPGKEVASRSGCSRLCTKDMCVLS